MEHILEQLGAVENLSPTDAVLARTLIRNGLLDAEQVLEAARAAAQDPDEGVLERLISSGHLHPGRAREIEQALEKKLAERCVVTDEPPVKRDPSMRWPTPFAKGPRMWRPRDQKPQENSAVILLKALRKGRAHRRRAAIEAAGKLEERLARSEAARSTLEAQFRDNENAKEQLVRSEALVEQLRRELASAGEENEALQAERDKLKDRLARLRKRPAATRKKPLKAKTAKTAKRAKKRAA